MKSTGLAFALALLSVAAAQAETTDADRQAQAARARCAANRGINCDTPAGLREWLLQERSRAEAVKEGSRHLPPAPPPPVKSRPR